MSLGGHLGRVLCAALLISATLGPAAAESAKPANQDDDDWQGLPAGPGREEVFYVCQICHSLALVKQQGLNRDTWDETLIWMVEDQDMEPLEPEDRKLILDYLSTHYGRDSKPRQR